MLDEISGWLEPLPDNMAWIPNETAEMLPQVAKAIWDRADESERALQSRLMMLAAHPTSDRLPGHAICFAYIFRSPDFVPIAKNSRCYDKSSSIISCGRTCKVT